MNIFDVIKKDEVQYINIDRLITDSEGTQFLEYFVWKYPVGLNLSGYKFRQELESAYKNIEELMQLSIPSNYTILDLKTSSVLSAINCKQSLSAQVLEPNACVKVELVFDENNIYNILHKLVSEGATINIEGSPGFSPAKNLSFNNDNFDIVFRYFDDEIGFKSYHVYKNGHMPQMTIRCAKALNIPHLHSHKIGTGEYEYIFNSGGVSSTLPKILVDGENRSLDLVLPTLSMETLILHYNEHTTRDNTQKICEALYQYLAQTPPQKFSRPDTGYYSRQPIKTCTVTTGTEKIVITNLRRMFESVNFEPSSEKSLGELTDKLIMVYDIELVEFILFNLIGYIGKSVEDIKVEAKINSMSASVSKAQGGILASALKETFYGSRIFRKVYENKFMTYQSAVFDKANVTICVHSADAYTKELLSGITGGME